jgi:hypothetical protein
LKLKGPNGWSGAGAPAASGVVGTGSRAGVGALQVHVRVGSGGGSGVPPVGRLVEDLDGRSLNGTEVSEMKFDLVGRAQKIRESLDDVSDALAEDRQNFGEDLPQWRIAVHNVAG